MNRALAILIMLFLLVMTGCDLFNSDGEEGWVSLAGYDFRVYMGHFDDIESTDEEGNYLGDMVLGGNGDTHDWEMRDYPWLIRPGAKIKKPRDAKSGFNVTAHNPLGDELNAEIFRDGVSTGFFTPHLFVDSEFLLGVYTVSLYGVAAWDPDQYEVVDNSYDQSVDFVAPLITDLSSFTVTLTAIYSVKIAWISQSETEMLGYRIYRGESSDVASAVLITPVMIPATNTSSPQSYSITDNEVAIGSTYCYWLEAVNYASSAFYGPVSITVVGEVPPEIPIVNGIYRAYPNPVSQGGSFNLHIAIKEHITATLLLLDSQAEVKKEYSLAPGVVNHLTVPTQDLIPGLYRVFLYTSDRQYAYGDVLVQAPRVP
ncbi:MAG: hypothetical protein KBA79_08070 [Candidatus Cloacimonetes bacterium]|nr:hypothetical protein [Candidatus Cloacimonadota bacterium]